MSGARPAPGRSDEPIRPPNNGEDQGLMHLDSAIGVAWLDLGEDRHLAVDGGRALGNQLTDLGEGITQRRHDSNHALTRLRQLRAQLPDASPAAAVLDTAITRLDAPDRPAPALPDGTPQPLLDLMHTLAAIPVVRRGYDPGHGDHADDAWHETDRAAALIHGWAAGDLTRGELSRGLLQLAHGRHELTEGHTEIRTAITAALRTERQWRRPDTSAPA